MKTTLTLLTCCAIAACLLSQTDDRSACAESKADRSAVARPVEEDMHEFMEYVFQPPYKRLKAALAKQPAGKAAWKGVKSDSLILAESANLLLARVPSDDGDDWIAHTTSVREAGSSLYQAAKKNDFAATSDAFARMLNQCNGCHRQFEDGKHILSP